MAHFYWTHGSISTERKQGSFLLNGDTWRWGGLKSLLFCGVIKYMEAIIQEIEVEKLLPLFDIPKEIWNSWYIINPSKWKKPGHTGVHSVIASLTERSIFSENLAAKNMYSPGPEGREGVSRKAKYTVPVRCAEPNPMICFPIPMRENSWLPNSSWVRSRERESLGAIPQQALSLGIEKKYPQKLQWMYQPQCHPKLLHELQTRFPCTTCRLA